jgi:hypothetical protein
MAPRNKDPDCDTCGHPMLGPEPEPYAWLLPLMNNPYLLPCYCCDECEPRKYHGKMFTDEAEANLALITTKLCRT